MKLTNDTPRLMLTRAKAAKALGISLRHFQRHVQPQLNCIYSGRLRLYPITELERWIDEQASQKDAAA